MGLTPKRAAISPWCTSIKNARLGLRFANSSPKFAAPPRCGVCVLQQFCAYIVYATAALFVNAAYPSYFYMEYLFLV
eukprot:6175898-Pleurochrysis_carterae.AAC.1